MRWLVRSVTARAFWADLVAGATLAAFVAAVLPGLRKYGRPLAVAVVADLLDVTDAVRSVVARLKEDLTDMVAEAQFSRFARELERTPSAAGSEPAGGLGGDSDGFKSAFGQNW